MAWQDEIMRKNVKIGGSMAWQKATSKIFLISKMTHSYLGIPRHVVKIIWTWLTILSWMMTGFCKH